MNKPDFINLVQEKFENDGEKITKAQIDKMINIIFGCLTDILTNKDEYNVSGFGTFKTTFKDAHKARNPKTGESIDVPGQYVAKFSFSSSIKNIMKNVK